jgi:hypothetical protein
MRIGTLLMTAVTLATPAWAQHARDVKIRHEERARLHRDCQVCPDEPGYGELHLTPKDSETINDCRRLYPEKKRAPRE